ncbi:ribonuclease H-like domain-containing protein [Tanacetum coccineum]
MDLETAQTTTITKLPILKQGEYDMWRLRIEQYFQVQDYALWDVIENGNSFKPAAHSNQDAKTLFAPIQTRFSGNEATKKTQKTLLKQMYENFSAPCTEFLDSIFNRLQKIVSQLDILGENISQEDLNLKFLRSLPSKWNTHVVVRRNKPDLDIMSFDNLYNNIKIVEQEVKKTASSSSSLSSQNMAFVSCPSSTNEVNTAYGVSTANTQVSPASTQVSNASTQVSTANISDATVYAFLANHPNGSQLVHEDLEQIHEDNIEYMDLKWLLALLSMRTIRNQGNSRRTVNVEETSSKAMVAIDEAGFDWSYMVDDEVPTNMALMAFSDSEFNLATYKRGLAFLEEQLVFYKKNEVIFYEQLVVLKRDISYKDLEISMLKSELEKLKQEKESNQLKIENFDNASKSLDKLIGSQITDKSRKGVGFVSYNAVPPPHTGLFSPPKLDLSNSGLEEFQQPEFEGYGPKTSKSVSEDISNEVRESPDAPLVEELVSDDKLEKKTVFPTVAKIEFVRPKQQEKPVRKPGHPQKDDQGYVDSGCSRHITGNMSYLSDFKEFDEGYMCDKKNNVLFTDTGCFVLSPDFKLADESQVLLKVPKKNNMYSVDMKNTVPKESLTCLVTNVTLDESMLWHRRLGHVNFKTINKLVKDNLVRGLPSKRFENDQTCVACLKGKQHKASCKFDGKSNKGFFIGYSLNSKAFRVYNIRTRKVKESLHLGTNSNDLVGTEESIGTCHSSKETGPSQDYILMPLWKDGLLFDFSSKNANNDEPQPSSDAKKKDDEGVNKESEIDDQERPRNNTQDVNTAGPSINNVSLIVTTAPLEATHADFFGDETELDMSNITTTYPIISTLNTRIHKDHSLDHVIGDIQSSVQTKRMTKTSNEQGFISAIYKGKTHEDLHTCLLACLFSITSRTQEGDLSFDISKLDRSNAE